MYSLLINCNKRKSFKIYHLLCSPDFDRISINIYKILFKHFSHNVEMIFYNMGNHFVKHKNTGSSHSSFYRMLTPFLINVERLIHLDGDTLIFQDLYKMYNLNFKDNTVGNMELCSIFGSIKLDLRESKILSTYSWFVLSASVSSILNTNLPLFFLANK